MASKKKVKSRDKKNSRDESLVFPIQFCHDRTSIDGHFKNVNGPSRRRGSLDSRKSISSATEMGLPRKYEPAFDEVAIRAVVSILSGYVGQYMKDEKFRETLKSKCYACCLEKNKDSDDRLFLNLEMGIENVERFVGARGTKTETRLKYLQYSFRLLSLVTTALNAKSSTPNSHLSACAHLYLAIVYKLEKNDRVSARHLLQVFCDDPFVARCHLLPELWDHLFLPHLLHLKIWHVEELDFTSNSSCVDKEIQVNDMNEVYNANMDLGTVKFALYYKEWLEVEVQAPAVPAVPLPQRTNRGTYSDSFSVNSSSNELLCRAVFGTVPEDYPTDLNDMDENSSNHLCLEDKEMLSSSNDLVKQHLDWNEKRCTSHRRSRSLIQRDVKVTNHSPDSPKTDHLHFLNCRSDSTKCTVQVDSTALVQRDRIWRNDLNRAFSTICTSESMSKCEMAIRVIAKAWLDSHGDALVESELSKVQAIEGVLDVLSASVDDEILELAISLLAQIVAKNELNANVILNFDPQLDIFARVLRNNSLFLKAAVLLHLVKPKAKQMIALEWILLVLRVLEFGDQLQTLFTIQCSPQLAAYYFLDELLFCFDEDRNRENARHVVSCGGLNLLLRRLEAGDIREKNKAVSIIYCCILADRSCGHYMCTNLSKQSLISLLLVKNKITSPGGPFALLTEMFCLSRQSQRIEFLVELRNGWGSFNTMQVMLVYLQRAQQEERPLVAAILLQLDLLGDPCDCSVYRAEAIDEIVDALDCKVFNEKVQEQCARALLILGGHFSYSGEPAAEKWLLEKAGFDDSSLSPLKNDHKNNKEENETETRWLRKTASVMLKNDSKRLFDALSESISNGIPCLARTSLVTVAWMSMFLIPTGGRNLQSLACSLLVSCLSEALNHERSMEERCIASFTLLNLLKGSDYVSRLSESHQELVDRLHQLSELTWTAKELISVITTSKRDCHLHERL